MALRLCAIEVAPARAEPDDSAEQVTQALQGEPLELEEENGDWARIRMAYDYPGWIRTVALGHVRGTVPRTWPPEPRPGATTVEEARAYLGARYEWGGMTERGIDCSGLVHMAHRRLGRLVPRDAHQQETAGEAVAESQLRTGNLVCFGPPDWPTTSRSGWGRGESCTRPTAPARAACWRSRSTTRAVTTRSDSSAFKALTTRCQNRLHFAKIGA